MKKLVSAVLLSISPMAAFADQQILDDLIVDGSACIGQDCVNGESFGFDTIRLKENNLRIKFQDTSNSASFPTNDWQITINDSSNGGANKFSIDDIDGGRTPFTIEAAARSNALYVESDGDIGIGTNNPAVDIHNVTGNTPTLRLDQDGSNGFTPQVWDLAGNEANFFIRDVTNGSRLTFRIYPGTADSNLVLKDDKVGILTTSPAETIHARVAGDTGLRLENTTASVGSTWRIYNQADTGKLKFTDDTTGARTPLKLEKDAVNNLVKIGTPVTYAGGTTNSQVEVIGTLTATYFADENGNIYKLSDIVNALQTLGQTLPTY